MRNQKRGGFGLRHQGNLESKSSANKASISPSIYRRNISTQATQSKDTSHPPFHHSHSSLWRLCMKKKPSFILINARLQPTRVSLKSLQDSATKMTSFSEITIKRVPLQRLIDRILRRKHLAQLLSVLWLFPAGTSKTNLSGLHTNPRVQSTSSIGSF